MKQACIEWVLLGCSVWIQRLPSPVCGLCVCIMRSSLLSHVVSSSTKPAGLTSSKIFSSSFVKGCILILPAAFSPLKSGNIRQRWFNRNDGSPVVCVELDRE